MAATHHNGAMRAPLPELHVDGDIAVVFGEDGGDAEESEQAAAKADVVSAETGSTGDEEQGFQAGGGHASSEEESGEVSNSGVESNTNSGENDVGDKCGAMPELGDKVITMPSTASMGIFERSQRRARIGFLAQYFTVGIIHSGVPATAYGVFLGYLNVPSYVYATVSVVSSLPWSFKFFFGLINDTNPICGLRRKPYMMMGWTLCTLALLYLGFTPLPDPYWCIDEATGTYIQKVTRPDGTITAAEPCNPEAATHGGKYAMILMVAALGYVIADVAADGLTTEYARHEPIERRGKTQTTAYLTRTFGGILSTLFIGLCMNGRQYNGTFSWSLSFEAVALVLAIPTALMVPISGCFVQEPQDPEKKRPTGWEYFAMCWELLKSKSCFYVILYCFLTHAVGHISTPAGGNVKKYWAGVENLQNQMFSLVGLLLFALGLALVRRYLLNTSWRMLLSVTIIVLQLIDSVFTSFTIFDVVRSQYFYLGETVLTELPHAAHFVVANFVIVEMADVGNEGMVYGLLTTASNLGNPVARAIGNQLYTAFQPSLSDSTNYIEDTPEFRSTVFHSFLLSYFFPILSLAAVWYLLPSQKQETQDRKRTWKKRPVYGVLTLSLLGVAFTYALTINFMAMFPATMCLKFAGGDGCQHSDR